MMLKIYAKPLAVGNHVVSGSDPKSRSMT